MSQQLTIITINRNNADGLKKTMDSVLAQSCTGFEYIVIDGASDDDSVDIIRQFANRFGSRLKWISEPDKGIYNAMNKGIGMATGEYIQILNSGDCLVSGDTTGSMIDALKQNNFPSILYGNMLKDMPDGRIVRDEGFAGQDITLLGFYFGTLNHSPAYIKKDLFDKYGYYDESLKIVSDWEWYFKAIIFGGEKPVYTDIDVTLFDMTGISETNIDLRVSERRQVLQQLLPSPVLADYDQWAFPIIQMKRLKRHPWAYKMVYLLERTLFKIERWKNACKKTR